MQVIIDVPDNVGKDYQELPKNEKDFVADQFSRIVKERKKERQVGSATQNQQEDRDSFVEFLEHIDEYAVEMPEDASINYKHYLYGHPKRT